MLKSSVPLKKSTTDYNREVSGTAPALEEIQDELQKIRYTVK